MATSNKTAMPTAETAARGIAPAAPETVLDDLGAADGTELDGTELDGTELDDEYGTTVLVLLLGDV